MQDRELLLDIHRAVGRIEGSVDALSTTVRDHSADIDSLKASRSWAYGAAATAGALFATVVSAIGWALNRAGHLNL